MFTDLRHAVRLFSRRPCFTAAIILTLALGIGANTAIFSLVRAVLLRPLPYYEPDRVVFALVQRTSRPLSHAEHFPLTGSHVIEWQERTTVFDSIAVVETWQTNLAPRMDLMTPDGAERLRGSFVTANFFELLGVRAASGRTFDSRDADAGTAVAVISDAFWRRRFGADGGIVGKTVDLIAGRGKNRTTTRHVVLGVLPPAFRFTYPEETEVWTVMPWSRIRPSPAAEFQLVARLEDGITPMQAQAALTPVLQRNIYRDRFALPESFVRDNVAIVETLPEHVSAEARPGVLLLLAGAGIVLLIACVNVALLLLALIVDRRREMAMRTAVGAPRFRIMRQLLIEGAVLATVGSAGGVALAWLLMPALRALIPAVVPRGDEISVDPVVLTFAGAAGAMTALVCGLAPAWHADQRDVQGGLRQSGISSTGDRRVTIWRRAIVAGQVAVVFVLLVAASLLLHSFWRMQRVDLGFKDDGLLTMEMRLLNPKYFQEGRLAQFERDVLERVRALPGVEQASMTTAVPFSGGTDFTYALRAVGSSVRKAANGRPVDPQYFSLMRIPLLAGRVFTEADDESAPRVAVVSESYGRSLFGTASPVGRHLQMEPGTVEIVGVVGDVRHGDVRTAGGPAIYLPREQRPTELICLIVKPAASAAATVAAVRAAVKSIDPEQPIEHVSTLGRLVRESTSEERFYIASTAGFAAVAVLLAIAGLAGVVSRTVTERAREIAIRMSLGAQSSDLVRLVIGHGMVPVLVGLGIGLMGAWGASRLLRSFLFEVTPLDPTTYAAATLLLGVVATGACYFPARRATRVEPMTALKAE
jgi:putative ABC transport system permease protein